MEETIAQINRYRRKCLFLFVLYIVLASVFGAGGFGGLITVLILELPGWLMGLGLGLSMFSFLIVTGIFVLLAIREPRLYLKRVYDTYVPDMGRGMYQDFSYVFAIKPDDPCYMASNRVRKRPVEFEKASLLKGSFKSGVAFSSFRYSSQGFSKGERSAMAVQEESRRRGSLSKANPFEYVTRHGRYIQFELTKESKAELLIYEKRSLRLFKKPRGYTDLSSESEVFNRMYDCFYKGEMEEAFKILDPELLAGVIAIDEQYDGRLSLSIRGKLISAYLDFYDQGLRISLTRKLTSETLRYLRYEVAIPGMVGKFLSLT